GITWFFKHVSEGIILEDDCWPSEDFFVFCETMLARYRNDSRVGMISGDNFQQGQKRPKASYYFSKYTHIWGWATWRRAWKEYDLEMNGLDDFFSSETWQTYQASERETEHWRSLMTKVRNGEIDTWDYQWNYAVWKSGALVVLPAVNLVANEGFRADATHTISENSPNAKLPTEPLGNIKLTSDVALNVKADLYSFENLFSPPKNTSPKSKAKAAAVQEVVTAKAEKKIQRAAEDLAAVKSSLSWRLLGKHVFSVEKRLRRLFGA
ncbi:MAG: hypothetical protein JWO08_3413, partial [Verrucomicrobiaceae bacterium]|nr:hypothetical protein [Verrucomicrobiaceae bacterium]